MHACYIVNISLPSFCHRNCSSSPVALTIKCMGVPVTTDWLSGCRLILGGSTVRKDLMVKVALKVFYKTPKYPELSHYSTLFAHCLDLLFSFHSTTNCIYTKTDSETKCPKFYTHKGNLVDAVHVI